METNRDESAQESERIVKCLNDLEGLLSFPLGRPGIEPSEAVCALLDSLIAMLELDFVYLRVEGGDVLLELDRRCESWPMAASASELGEGVEQALGKDTARWPSSGHICIAGNTFCFASVSFPIGVDRGILGAACHRKDFPLRAETLLLRVAANRSLVYLQEARLRPGGKRAADDFDRGLAQGTKELREMIDAIPALAWSRGNSDEGSHLAADNAHGVKEGQPVGILIGAQSGFVHEAAHGEMRHQQAVELLPYQIRRFTAQHDTRSSQMSLEFVERSLSGKGLARR